MLLEEYLKKIQNKENINEVIGVMAALTAGMLAVTALDAFKDFMSKAARQCFALQGTDRSKCMIKMRIEGTRKLVMDLEKRKTLCRKARKPEKCMMQMDKKINKQKEKLKMYADQFKVITMK